MTAAASKNIKIDNNDKMVDFDNNSYNEIHDQVDLLKDFREDNSEDVSKLNS